MNRNHNRKANKIQPLFTIPTPFVDNIQHISPKRHPSTTQAINTPAPPNTQRTKPIITTNNNTYHFKPKPMNTSSCTLYYTYGNDK